MPLKIRDIHKLLSPFLVTGLSGPELTDAEREILSESPPAGVILFSRNVESVGQLRRLTEETGRIIGKASGATPLIMADHEGGRISVLAKAIGTPPSQMASWSPGSGELLESITRQTARRMRSCGLNLTLSPVADVASEPLNPVIGTRAFGEDPGPVSDAVRIAVRSIAGEKLLSCLKHFPGHGSTSADSHLSLPVIGKTADRLREEDLPPFIAGMQEGADLVMTAHIALGEGGPPASLDRKVVTDLLRAELGFEGVVITDALEMAGALPDRIAMRSVDPSAGDKSESAVPSMVIARAREAGNDLLLMSRPLEEVYGEISGHAEALSEALAGADAADGMAKSAGRISSARNRAPRAGGQGGAVCLPAADDSDPEFRLFHALFRGMEGLGAPVLPVFLGERTDFDSETVRRFIRRVVRAFRLPGDKRGDIQITPVFVKGAIEPELLVYEPVLGPGSGRCLVILCRRPLPAGVIREASSGFDAVVAAERPWDAGHVPEGVPAEVIYGTWDMAADLLGTAFTGIGKR